MLSSATALYSSGPVTPSMWKTPVVVVAQGTPQPGGLHQQFHARVAFEALVARGLDVPHDGVGDARVHMEGGGAGRPVRGALRALDGAPGERGAAQAELGGPLPGGGQDALPPAQRLGGGLRHRADQQGQHEHLGVPEGVPVVAGAGEALGGYRAPLGAGARLEDVEEGEAHGLLDLLVAVDLHVGAAPERVQVVALFVEEALPAAVRGGRQRRLHLVAHRGPGAGAGPAVGDELLHPQPLARLQDGGDRQPGRVDVALAGGDGPSGPVDDVVGGDGDPQAAAPGAVHQPQPAALGEVLLVLQRGAQRARGARVAVGSGQGLVGDEFGLHHHPGAAVDGLHLVRDGGDDPLGEGHQPGRAHPDGGTGRRGPLADPFQDAAAQVEGAFVVDEPPVAQIERLVVDEEPDHLAVGDVDDGLPGLGVAVAGPRRKAAGAVRGRR